MVIPLFFELFLMATGCALILATFFVRFRDLGQVWEVLLHKPACMRRQLSTRLPLLQTAIHGRLSWS